ncbi:MAG TPA: hypothetical protein VN030_09800 [Cellvibrio sp.]|nr:hypothetical protein [Cellvibrio sp.]
MESYQFINGEWKFEAISFGEGFFASAPIVSVDGKLLYVMVKNSSSEITTIYSVNLKTLKTTVAFNPIYLEGGNPVMLSDDELLVYGSSYKKTLNLTTGEIKNIKVNFDDSFSIYNSSIVSMDRQYMEIGVSSGMAIFDSDTSSGIAIFDSNNYSFSLMNEPVSRAVNKDGSIRIQQDTAVDINGLPLGKLKGNHAVVFFDMLNNRLYGNSFDSKLYLYDFSGTNSNGEFEYETVSVDIPLESNVRDAFSISPSGRTLFSVIGGSLNIRSLEQ